MKTLIRLLPEEQSDLGLHCLPRPICPKTLGHYGKSFQTFDDEIAEFDSLCEDSYKDKTLDMQTLQDMMTVSLYKYRVGGNQIEKYGSNNVKNLFFYFIMLPVHINNC